MDESVRIYLNRDPLIVPEVVDCHHAARGVLGLRRGEGVRRDDGNILAFPETGWTFAEGEHYFTVSGDDLMTNGAVPHGEPHRKDPWTMNPNWWRLGRGGT